MKDFDLNTLSKREQEEELERFYDQPVALILNDASGGEIEEEYGFGAINPTSILSDVGIKVNDPKDNVKDKIEEEKNKLEEKANEAAKNVVEKAKPKFKTPPVTPAIRKKAVMTVSEAKNKTKSTSNIPAKQSPPTITTPSSQPAQKSSVENKKQDAVKKFTKDTGVQNKVASLEPLLNIKKSAIRQAKTEFAQLQSSVAGGVRNKYARAEVRSKFRAIEKSIKKNNISFGSKEYVEKINEFFPGLKVNQTLTDDLLEKINDVVKGEPEEEKGEQSTENSTGESQNQESGGEQSNGQPTNGAEEVTATEKQEEKEEKQNQEPKKESEDSAVNSGEKKKSSKGEGEKAGEISGGSGAGGMTFPDPGGLPSVNVEKGDSDKYVETLGKTKASQFISEMKVSRDVTKSIQEGEKTDLKDNLPEIDQPTGLQLKSTLNPKEKQEEKIEGEKEPTLEPEGKKDVEKQPETHHVGEEKVALPQTPKAKEGEGSNSDNDAPDPAAIKAKEQMLNMPSQDNGMNSELGEKPDVNLEGQASPEQNEANLKEAGGTTDTERTKFDEASNENRGEDKIFPELEIEKLSPQTELAQVEEANGIELPEIQTTEIGVTNAFDIDAVSHMEAERAGEVDKAVQGKADMEKDMDKEQLSTESEIDAETKKVKAEQEKAQTEAKGQVDKEREGWKTDNEKVISDFQKDAEKEHGSTSGKIDDEVTKTRKGIDKEYADADKEIKKEEDKSAKQAKEEKAKAKKKKKGFWGWLSSAVTALFDAIKSAVNAIFDALRALVKAVIEAAKKAVNALIDMARDMIIGLIKAFGELLKSLVKVALAAFPKLRDKFLKAIDKAVEVACDAVNKLAEGLKKAVNALLDALGAVLDFILSAYQKLINAVLDVLEFLTAGIIKILEGLTNIGISIGYGVGALKGALVKEFIGEDITAPLPSVEASEAELPELMAMQASIAQDVAEATEISAEAEAQLNTELDNKTMLSDDDFVLDGDVNAPLDGDLIKNILPQLNAEGKIELGGAADPVNAQDLQDATAGGEGVGEMGGGDLDADAATAAETPQYDAETIEWLKKSDSEKLDWNIEQMGADSSEPDSKAKKSTPPSQSEMASPGEIARKTGRLGVGTRLGFVGRQMLKGMQMWWSKNKTAVYLALAGILLVAGVVAFFTGGAGLVPLLQLAIQAMTVYFIADALIKIKGHLWDWLSKAWNGDTKGGGESLAQAIAVIFSEFLFEYVLKGIGKVLKRIKKMVKATKTFKRISKGTRKVVAGLKRSKIGKRVRKTIRGVSKKGGKFSMKMKKGWQKGTKKLGDLRKKILDKFGFKRIWIEKTGKWIELWGEFNSKVLISKTDADGNQTVEIKDIDASDLGDNAKVGSKFKHDGGDAITIDRTGNAYSQSVNSSNAKSKFNELDELDNTAARSAKIQGGVNDRVSLRKDVEHKVWAKTKYSKKHGQFRDPNTGKLIPHLDPPKYFPADHPHAGKRVPRADIGHTTGNEWKKRRKMHQERGSTREEMIEMENNPDLYHIEDRSSNRGHGFEEK